MFEGSEERLTLLIGSLVVLGSRIDFIAPRKLRRLEYFAAGAGHEHGVGHHAADRPERGGSQEPVLRTRKGPPQSSSLECVWS